MKLSNKKNRKQALLSVLLFVVVIALYIEFNVLIDKIGIDNIDATGTGIYSISDESKNKISKIDKNVEINMIDFDNYTNYSMVSDVVNLINLYPKINNKITVNSSITENIEDKNEIYPHLIIKTEEKEHEITIDELFLYKYMTEGSYNDEYYICEEVITNLITNVVKNDNKKIYIYTDKMIYGQNYLLTLCNRIKNLGNDLAYLSLENIDNIPENSECIIIPPLSQDLSESEKSVLVKYIENGGNIMFLQESKSLTNVETPNLDTIMELYGFGISKGVLLAKQNRVMANNPGMIYANVNCDDIILKNMQKNSKICVVDSGVINIENQDKLNELGVSYSILAYSGKDTYLRNDLKDNNIDISETDIEMPDAILGLRASKKVGDNTSNAIVFSSSLFITDRPVYVQDILTGKNVAVSLNYLNDNEEIVANSIKYLSKNEDSIINRKRHYDSVPSVALMKDGITLKLVFALPLIIIFIGYVVWRHRKNKK